MTCKQQDELTALVRIRATKKEEGVINISGLWPLITIYTQKCAEIAANKKHLQKEFGIFSAEFRDLRDTLSHVPIIQSPQHRAKTRFEHKHPGSNLDSMNTVPFILSRTSPPPPSHFLCTVFCQSNESFLIFRSSSFGSLCGEVQYTLITWLYSIQMPGNTSYS